MSYTNRLKNKGTGQISCLIKYDNLSVSHISLYPCHTPPCFDGSTPAPALAFQRGRGAMPATRTIVYTNTSDQLRSTKSPKLNLGSTLQIREYRSVKPALAPIPDKAGRTHIDRSIEEIFEFYWRTSKTGAINNSTNAVHVKQVPSAST
jgi:hypothetical protein